MCVDPVRTFSVCLNGKAPPAELSQECGGTGYQSSHFSSTPEAAFRSVTPNQHNNILISLASMAYKNSFKEAIYFVDIVR